MSAARMCWAAGVAASLALGAAACDDGPAVPAVEFGAQIFADPRLANNPDNTFSCATCHDTTPAPDPARILPGYTLYDSAFRPTWWGGFEVDYLRAVNFCFTKFMRAEQPLLAEEPKAMALYEYLQSISPTRPAPARPLTFQKYVLSMSPGDAVRGSAVYAAACAGCHGAIETGDGKLAPAPKLPEAIAAAAKKLPSAEPSTLVIEKVRHGQFWGLGGVSPPFSLQAMSDEDLAALLGFLEQ